MIIFGSKQKSPSGDRSKAPNQEIDEEAMVQAYAYAIHSNVRAIYFVVCHSRKLNIFKTDRSPDHPPILKLNYIKFNECFYQIESLLKPTVILNANPNIDIF